MICVELADGLVVGFPPRSAAKLADLDRHTIASAVHALIRRHHPPPVSPAHDGPPEESASLWRVRREGDGFWFEIRYLRNEEPNSRYDKSRQARGWLTLGPDGRAASPGALGRLRYR